MAKFIKDKKKFNDICNELHSGKIGTKETCMKHLELVEEFSLEKFNEHISEEEIDEHFGDFVSFCNDNNFEVYVLSGGWDYYIDNILKRENIKIKFFSTRMIWDEFSGELSSEFIYEDEYCRLCETCKRNILINKTNDLENEISVFIGNGNSDFCVSNYADIVFAKGRLASYCWKNNITYYDYNNFSDVKNKIIKILCGNRIKHRREAFINRRDVVMGG